MDLIEVALLLFLVVDPFGNLPLVLGLLKRLRGADFRRAVLRETALAFAMLAVFGCIGDVLLRYLNVTQPSLNVAGGVILFLISLKMIYGRSNEWFEDRYADNPLVVPIAVPAIAGPAALTTVMVLKTRDQIPLWTLLAALGLVFAVTLITFLLGPRLGAYLGSRGLNALEKLMGMLLNLVSVNLIMNGAKTFFA